MDSPKGGQEGRAGETQHQKAEGTEKNEAAGKGHLKGVGVEAGYLKGKRNKASGRESK